MVDQAGLGTRLPSRCQKPGVTILSQTNLRRLADIQGFRFNNPNPFDASGYDEAWPIGIPETPPGSVTGLTDVELRILSQFISWTGRRRVRHR